MKKSFYLVILQVATDSQLKNGSNFNDNEEFIHWESEEMTEEWKENLKVLGMTHELWDGRYFESLIEMGVLV